VYSRPVRFLIDDRDPVADPLGVFDGGGIRSQLALGDESLARVHAPLEHVERRRSAWLHRLDSSRGGCQSRGLLQRGSLGSSGKQTSMSPTT
jgi:hypothetical protein